MTKKPHGNKVCYWLCSDSFQLILHSINTKFIKFVPTQSLVKLV